MGGKKQNRERKLREGRGRIGRENRNRWNKAE
jgi:hypothetical protein